MSDKKKRVAHPRASSSTQDNRGAHPCEHAPRSTPASHASRIIGPNPKGQLRIVSLAVKHFLESLESLDPKSPLLVGLSGGADSLALTLGVIDWATRTGRQVHTLTIDHGLRPESAQEAEKVAALARELGALADIEKVEIGSAGGPEGAAREKRREALARRAQELGAPVLLGHTLNDQAETVLLRLARGSGAHSLRAIRPRVFDSQGLLWLRPLLGVRRETTEGACEQAGLEWVKDPTNEPQGPWRAADGGPLRRSAVRAHALPSLAEALGVDPIPALARSAELAARDDEALASWAKSAWHTVKREALFPDGSRAPALDILPMVELPMAIRTRIIRRFCLEGGARAGALSSRLIDEVDALLCQWHGQKGVDLAGVRLRRRRDIAARPVLLVENTH